MREQINLAKNTMIFESCLKEKDFCRKEVSAGNDSVPFTARKNGNECLVIDTCSLTVQHKEFVIPKSQWLSIV